MITTEVLIYSTTEQRHLARTINLIQEKSETQPPSRHRLNRVPLREHFSPGVPFPERLGVSERFVRRFIAERRVPFFKVGKFIRFGSNDIDRWIENRRIV